MFAGTKIPNGKGTTVLGSGVSGRRIWSEKE